MFMVPDLGVPEPQPVKTDAQISAITDAVAIGLNILAIVLHQLDKCREFGPLTGKSGKTRDFVP